jgi:hypothetical protein
MIVYIRTRLNERSTWLLIGTGIAGAAALVSPWSYVAAVVGAIAAFVPDGPVK